MRRTESRGIHAALCTLTMLAVAPLASSAADLSSSRQGAPESLIERVISPAITAQVIVEFVAKQDYNLMEMVAFDRPLQGEIVKVLKGEHRAIKIFHPAGSAIMPIQAGVSYHLFLLERADTGWFYSIAIYPATAQEK